eukprot:scaffold12158_cov85-Skeletonema_dohrnii-CCMP3373.AAC.3
MGHYKQLIAIITAWDRYGSRVALSAVSRHLRHCSDAVTSNKYLSRAKNASILSWPTIMGHYKQLIAIFTAWDTIWFQSSAVAVGRTKLGLIRSPTTL